MNKKILFSFFVLTLFSCNPISYPHLEYRDSPIDKISIIKNPNPSLKVKEIKVPYDKLEISIGDFYTNQQKRIKNIIAEVKLSDNSIENDVDWYISDNSIAKINNYGVLIGLKEGNIIVTAVSRRDTSKKSKFLVTVYSSNFEPKKCPNKHKIAFISNKDGINDLYLINIDGSNQIKIAENIFVDSNRKDNFSWSPDGTRIFYTTNANTYHILNVDTNTNTKINLENYPFNVTWSPDSSKLAFTNIIEKYDPNSEVFIINNDGTNLVKLRDKKFNFNNFFWSPDSKKLLYYYAFNAVSVYNLVNQDDLFVTEAKDFCWHPDSSKVLFVPVKKEIVTSADDISSPIFQIDIDGNNLKEFYKNTGLTYSKFSLSTDNKQISVVGTNRVKEFNTYIDDIYIFSDKGELIKKLTNNTLLSFDNPYKDIENRNLDKLYLSKFNYTSNPIWFNSNKNLLIDIRENVSEKYGYGFNKTFIISTETGNMIEVDLDNKKNFSYNSNDKIVYTESKNSTDKIISNEIYTYDITNSQITRITNNNYINSQKKITDVKDIEIKTNSDNELIDKNKLKEKFFITISNNPIDGFVLTKTNIIDNKIDKIDSFFGSNPKFGLSKNREKIAYMYTKANDNYSELTILNFNDSKKVKIKLNNTIYDKIDWVLNDEYILLQSNFNNTNFSIIKNDGTDFKSLENIIDNLSIFITSSKDSKSIFYYKYNSSTINTITEIYQLNLDTMENKLLFSKTGQLRNIVYSNKQDKILYDLNYNLYTIDSNGYNQKQITFNNDIVNYSSISFSPNDKKILYNKSDARHKTTINIMDSDGTNDKSLTYTEDIAANPFWSDDGNYIYYSAVKDPIVYFEEKPISLDIGNNLNRKNTNNSLRKIYVMTNEGKNKTPLVDSN